MQVDRNAHHEMCERCLHKRYCLGAFKKDNWCGNFSENKDSKFAENPEKFVIVDRSLYSECDKV